MSRLFFTDSFSIEKSRSYFSVNDVGFRGLHWVEKEELIPGDSVPI